MLVEFVIVRMYLYWRLHNLLKFNEVQICIWSETVYILGPSRQRGTHSREAAFWTLNRADTAQHCALSDSTATWASHPKPQLRHTVSKLTHVPLNAKPFERLALKLPALILEKFKWISPNARLGYWKFKNFASKCETQPNLHSTLCNCRFFKHQVPVCGISLIVKIGQTQAWVLSKTYGAFRKTLLYFFRRHL